MHRFLTTDKTYKVAPARDGLVNSRTGTPVQPTGSRTAESVGEGIVPFGFVAIVPPALAGASVIMNSLGHALGFALHWVLVCVLCALIWRAVAWWLARLSARHSVRHATERTAPLFVPFYFVALAGSCLEAEMRAVAVRAPLLAMLVPVLFPLFYYLFSDDHFAPRWVRWLVVIYTLDALGALIPSKPPSPQFAHVVASAPLFFNVLGIVGEMSAVTVVVLGVLPQVYARSRASWAPPSPSATRSFDWWRGVQLTLSGAAVLLIAGLFDLPSAQTLTPTYLVARTLFFLLATLLPVGAAFLLAQRGRYDRAAVINRLLVSSALTVSLVGIYLLCALALWLVLPGLVSVPSAAYLPFVLVTAIVLAMVFRSLRRRLRAEVDRRFFPRTYEAATVFAAVPSALGPTSHLETLGTQLITTIEKALQPAVAALWLCPIPERLTFLGERTVVVPAAVASSPTTETPLGYQHREGAIRLYRQVVTRRPNAVSDAPASDGRGAREDATVADLSLDPPTAAMLHESPAGLICEHLPDGPAPRAWRAERMVLALPVVTDEGLVGAITLGEPLCAPPFYTADERSLLAALISAVAPTLRAAQWEHDHATRVREQERIEQELQTARRIQESLLPKSVPMLDGWQFAAHYQPAREVGGDFYDFLSLPDGRLGLVLGDVTGKGMPAALVMATTRSMLRAVAAPLSVSAVSPGHVLAHVNDVLCPDLPPGMFVTCFYAILDPVTGQICFANAGQDLPCLRRRDGTVQELYATGMPLGLMPGMRYDEHEAMISPGERLLFYSDGIVEAHNPAHEMFGYPRLQALLASRPEQTAVVADALTALADFTGTGWEQEDDITLVALQRLRAVEGAGAIVQDQIPPTRQALTDNGDGTSASGDAGSAPASWRVLGKWQLTSAPGNEREAIRRVEAAVRGLALSPERLEHLKTAVGEATMNAMEHGNAYRADLPVAVEVSASATALRIGITDEGGNFSLRETPAPDLEAKLAGLQSPRGWGLFLIERLVDEVRVTGDDEGHHTIELHMRLPA